MGYLLRCAQTRGGAGSGARPSHGCWFAVPAGHATACKLSVQTCAGAGRGLRRAAARAAPRAARSRRRHHRRPIRRHSREPAGTTGAPLHRGWADRESREPMGQGGTAVAGPLGIGRGRGAANPRLGPDRDLASDTPLRREQIKLQVALIAPLIHLKGYAAPETKSAEERARQLIETAEAFGEPPDDPLLFFSVLYGFWVANMVAFGGDSVRQLAAQFLELAEKQATAVPLMIGDRLMGSSLLFTGDIAQGQAHFNRAIALTIQRSIVL